LPDYNLNSDTPLAERIELLQNAVLVPLFRDHPGDALKTGGVFREDGRFAETSLAFIEPHRQVNHEPGVWDADAVENRKGTWLFGGKHDLRFGHFMVETTSRLWALDHVGGPVQGVVYLPQNSEMPPHPMRRVHRSLPMFKLFGSLPNPEITEGPTRFERLIMAPQACGAGLLAPGSPDFRDFVRRRLRSCTAPEGSSKKLYVSRSRLTNTPGQILFERELEKALVAEGYSIFHPQEHDLPTQIGMYRGAETILGIESSAFHLIAFAARPGTRIGFIRRRFGHTSDGILMQLKAFTGDDPADIEAVSATFTFPRTMRISNSYLGPRRLSKSLRLNGFVSRGFRLGTKTKQEIEAEKQRLSRRVLEGILAE